MNFETIIMKYSLNDASVKKIYDNDFLLIPLPFACKEGFDSGLAIEYYDNEFEIYPYFSNNEKLILESFSSIDKQLEPKIIKLQPGNPLIIGRSTNLEDLVSNISKHLKLLSSPEGIKNVNEIEFRKIYNSFLAKTYFEINDNPEMISWMPDAVYHAIYGLIAGQYKNNKEEGMRIVRAFELKTGIEPKQEIISLLT